MTTTIQDYENIDRPYDSILYRSEPNVSNGNVETQPVKSDGAMSDVWIKNFVKSENWKPKKQGFYIDGGTGYAEFTNVYISGDIQALTGTIGGFTIGATDLSATSGGNTTIISSGATAFTSGPTGAPTVTISQAGAVNATSGSIAGTFTVGGRLATTLGGAINVAGNLITDVINTKFDTSAKQILGSFTFGASGAIRVGSVSNGVAISPAGILGTNGGNTTFAIDSSGNATFAGELVAASGTFGTITSGDLEGVTITGSIIQTDYSGARVVLDSSNYIQCYDSSELRINIGTESIDLYDANGDLSGSIYGSPAGLNAVGIDAEALFYVNSPVTWFINDTAFFSRIFFDGAWRTTWPSSGAAGANTSLSNLITTSINQSLRPSSSYTYNLGSSSRRWDTLYVGSIMNDGGGNDFIEVIDWSFNFNTLMFSEGVYVGYF